MTAEENRAYMATKQKEYRKRNADNPEYRKRKQIADKKYNKSHKMEISERKKATYALNPEPTKERVKQYNHENTDKTKEYLAQNKEKIRQRERGYREQNKEHIAEGGAHTYENVQVAHFGCNSRKGNRI